MLAPKATAACHPPVFVDTRGRRVEDPLGVLGLSGQPDEAAVRAAWRKQTLEKPPEQFPEAALAVREARERILDPERILERELGMLHVPRAPEGEEREDLLDAMGRLMGQAVLYALLEEELWGPELQRLYRSRR